MKNIKKNGTIFAFEPSKVNLKFLRYHISCNKLQLYFSFSSIFMISFLIQ